MKLFKLGLNTVFILRKYGIRISRDEDSSSKENLQKKKKFIEQARKIYNDHLNQTQEIVVALNKKYEEPVFGKVRVWNLIELLSQCIDPTDPALYCVSQFIHALQIVEGMERDGIRDPDLFITALIHDLGKVLLLKGEDPENVVCFNMPLGDPKKGVGLNQCLFQWNHEEFVYQRLKDHVPDHVAWLIRYHGIHIPACESLMNEQDRIYTDRYLRVFQKYDKGTKSIYHFPKVDLKKYHSLIEEAFPEPIDF